MQVQTADAHKRPLISMYFDPVVSKYSKPWIEIVLAEERNLECIYQMNTLNYRLKDKRLDM